MRFSDDISHLLSALRLSPPGQGISGAGHECFVRASTIPPHHQAHVHRCGFAIASSLAFDEELLHDAGEKLRTGLPLACTDDNSTADLVEDRRRALLIRRVDDVLLERIDCRQLTTTAIQPKLARIMCRR